EAFLGAWPRLANWLREQREFLVFKGEAERAERRWQEMGKSKAALLGGIDLVRAQEWLPRAQDLSRELNDYVRESISADKAEKERRLRSQRRLTIAAAAAALAMAVIGASAWLQWGRATTAERAANQALANVRDNESRALAALSMVAAKDSSHAGI